MIVECKAVEKVKENYFNKQMKRRKNWKSGNIIKKIS